MRSNIRNRRKIRLMPFLVVAGLGVPTFAMAQPEPAAGMADKASEAEIPAPTLDTNGDGVADAWDRNGDGKPDAWDTTGDGKPDKMDDGAGTNATPSAEPQR